MRSKYLPGPYGHGGLGGVNVVAAIPAHATADGDDGGDSVACFETRLLLDGRVSKPPPAYEVAALVDGAYSNGQRGIAGDRTSARRKKKWSTHILASAP